MNFKGISPLVATVLLIGVTMAVAGLLAVFGQNLVSEKLSESLEEPVASECGFGSFVIDACSYDPDNQRITFILSNIGTVDLTNVTAYVKYPDNSIVSGGNSGNLKSGSLASFTASGVTSNYTEVVIRTHCVNVFEETTCK